MRGEVWPQIRLNCLNINPQKLATSHLAPYNSRNSTANMRLCLLDLPPPHRPGRHPAGQQRLGTVRLLLYRPRHETHELTADLQIPVGARSGSRWTSRPRCEGQGGRRLLRDVLHRDWQWQIRAPIHLRRPGPICMWDAIVVMGPMLMPDVAN